MVYFGGSSFVQTCFYNPRQCQVIWGNTRSKDAYVLSLKHVNILIYDSKVLQDIHNKAK